MAVQMKALKSFVCAGKRIKAGDVFTAPGTLRPGSEAMTLKAIGFAEEYREPVTPPAYLTRVMTAAPVVRGEVVNMPNISEAAPKFEHAKRAFEPGTEYQLRDRGVVVSSGDGQTGADGSAPDMDTMSKDELHALAAKLGVEVHHRAGADKVRQAIREAKQ
jgi:hypothetical protein